jgi:hypothetical protein
LLVAACTSHHEPRTPLEFARRACNNVRLSTASKKMEPKRTYRYLDKAVDDARRAGPRYAALTEKIEDFRATIRGEATLTQEARFAAAAHFAKKECAKVDIDIGIIG